MSLRSLTGLAHPRVINTPGIHPISDGFGVFYKGVAMVGDRFRQGLDWLGYIPIVGKAVEDISEGALSVFKLGFDVAEPAFASAQNIFSRIEESSNIQALYKQFYGSYGIDPTERQPFIGRSFLPEATLQSAGRSAGRLSSSGEIIPPLSISSTARQAQPVAPTPTPPINISRG